MYIKIFSKKRKGSYCSVHILSISPWYRFTLTDYDKRTLERYRPFTRCRIGTSLTLINSCDIKSAGLRHETPGLKMSPGLDLRSCQQLNIKNTFCHEALCFNYLFLIRDGNVKNEKRVTFFSDLKANNFHFHFIFFVNQK